MRASRLLSIMMLLQTRGRMSAEALASELEVSVRTIYRDVDQLSASGVPVYADIGRNGGFALLDGWKTKLTGLTAPEAQALFLSGLPGPAAEMGLGDEVQQAELKLLAALPADWQSEAKRISSRFHLDPNGWFQPGHSHAHLKAVADAVWAERRLSVRYESWTKTSDRVLEPYGLVLKGGIWYVVARSGENVRTFRLSAIQALIVLDETFSRPKDFSLPAYWAEATGTFERDVYVGQARVRLTQKGLRELRSTSVTMRGHIDSLTPVFDESGWTEIEIPIEQVGWARIEMIKLCAEVEVLSPPELRDAVAEVVQRMANIYR
jgi:predicted DNA-binding transcriptional regulator YafY